MPKTSAKSLRTKAAFNKKPSVQNKRVAQNRARRRAMAKGKVAKGDGKDVHHVKMLAKGGSTKSSNTAVVSRKSKRGWRSTHPKV